MARRGQYEPKDWRSWSHRDRSPPRASAGHPEPRPHDDPPGDESWDEDEDAEMIAFEPAPELERMIEQACALRRLEKGGTRH